MEGVLHDDKHTEQLGAGPAHRHTLRVGPDVRAGPAWVWGEGAPRALHDTVRFEWEALDSWFEEDEPVFVHPRSPYSRVDALRSSSSVRVELDGVVLADAADCVKLFETGRPTRYRDSFAVLRGSPRGEANLVPAVRSVAVLFRRSRNVRGDGESSLTCSR